MPRWDFSCDTCHTTVELTFKTAEAAASATCPTCGRPLTRQPAAPNFTVHGYNARNGYSKR